MRGLDSDHHDDWPWLAVSAPTYREGVIPREVLMHARGIVFMTQIKGAWLFSGTLGTGIFMKRLSASKWSPPASIVMTSVGVGLQAGGQKADIVIVLNDDNSVRAFESHGQLKLGGDYAISAGPLGRTIKAEFALSGQGFSGMFSYSMSQGFFAGVSLEGVLLVSRATDNRGFYGTRNAHLRNIVRGDVSVPSGLKAELVAVLQHVLTNLCTGRAFEDGLDDLRNNPELMASLTQDDADLAGDPRPNPRDDDDLVRKQRQQKKAQAPSPSSPPPPPPPPPQPQPLAKQQQQQQPKRAPSSSHLTRRMTDEEHAMAADGRNILAGALDMHSRQASASPSSSAQAQSSSARQSAGSAGFAPRSLEAPLAYGSTKIFATKDHVVNESDPAMTAHNIITVRRGDPLFLLDGSLQTGMPYPYADYVSVQRLSDGHSGKVSKYCLAYSL
ncbi:SH3 domain-containing YSC84-like protein 1 [Hondaea fermentalgiana]|uniref:SH3 domain-containing YSC84-like protein 1 n=1 Tax=Hondaea fermentalgiana TaxID=2315210 RepID=A0A2R5GIU9_9STRA|nr:SH3 domain-containing YSC84-like protein 1 [Hondaea fermentalgiana]|eukprot:GBG30239.1 SH3 domain-containing YSC84-like protein 1 [Hondaea fermentalgiana]